MAKLRSSSCGPLVQGMMLLALLLVPSIQAAPAMAMAMAEFEQGAGKFKEAAGKLKEAAGKLKEAVAGEGNKQAPMIPREVHQVPEEFSDRAETTAEKAANVFLTDLAKNEGWKEFANGAKKGIKFRKYWCKAQGLMDKLGGATDLGRLGDLATNLSTFSYELTSEVGFDVCWSKEVPAAGTRATTTLVPTDPNDNDGRYFVQITGIRVGQGPVVWTKLNLPPPAYLSTIQPYTYIESNLYASLREAVVDQMKALNPGALITAADNLCYDAALWRPHIAIVLQTMELGGAPDDTAWYTDSYSSKICLGILPATTVQPPVLGSAIQSGKTMTIDLTAAGGQGTLTFTT